MENMQSRLHITGQTLDSSPSARIKPRPARNGAFEDLGSGFRRTETASRSTREPTAPRETWSGSEDEMDCLSQKSPVAEKRVVGKSRTGRPQSSYDPEVLETKNRAMKKLKFNKKTSPSEVDSSRMTPAQLSSTLGKTQAGAKPLPCKIAGSSKIEVKKGIRANVSKAKDDISDSTTTRTTRPKPRRKLRSDEQSSPLTSEDINICIETERPKKSLARTFSEFPVSPLSKSTAKPRKQISPASSANHSTSLDDTSSSSSLSEQASLSLYKRTPTLSSPKPASPRLQDFPNLSPFNSQKVKRGASVTSGNFPVISPLSKDRTMEASPTSFLSRAAPEGSFLRSRKIKGKQKSGPLTPFPMSTQELSCASPSLEEPHRISDQAQKRIQRVVDGGPGLVDNMNVYEEEDSLFMPRRTNPKTLCPYCDSPLPTSPTPFFQALVKASLVTSLPDPRYANPLGRRAPLSTFVPVCQRHEFEAQVLPEAEAKGWPKAINWEALSGRVVNMRPELEEIVQDSGEEDLPFLVLNLEEGSNEDSMTNYAGKGPRIRCVFWREAMRSVVQRGVRAMTGVRGQFSDFEKSQPGYYGELGSMIIQQTLFNMFPPDSFDPETIAPFTTNDFLQRFLVPEVALRLIMEDRDLKGLAGADAALLILRESTAYGVTMFPEDGGENTGAAGTEGKKGGNVSTVGIGDRIVMERARKRRKEIENDPEMEALFGGALFEDEKENEGPRKEGRRGELSGRNSNASDATKGIELEGLILNNGKMKSSRKKSKQKADGRCDSDAISITSTSDGIDSERDVSNSKTRTRGRTQGNTKTAGQADPPSDSDGNKISKRVPQPKNKPPSRSIRRSPPTREWPSSWPSPVSEMKEATRPSRSGSEARPSDASDMEICSTDSSIGSRTRNAERKTRSNSRAPSVSTSTKRRQHPQSDKRQFESTQVVDLDIKTPMPKRGPTQASQGGGNDESTPKALSKAPSVTVSCRSQPQKQSVLALARARTANNPERVGGMQTADRKKPTAQDPKWKYNYRSDMPGGATDCSSDSGSIDVEVTAERGSSTKKDKGDCEDYAWLLDF